MSKYHQGKADTKKSIGLLSALRKANAELLADPAHEQLYNAAEEHFAANRKSIAEIREKIKHAGRTKTRTKP